MSSRVDVWDARKAHELRLDCGFDRGLLDRFELGAPLGEGGFGEVRVARDRRTGEEYACKTIAKRLDVPNLPPAKQEQHVENIRREVAVLKELRGVQNVVALEGAYEDDDDAHIVMELCRGGELFHRIGRRHYSERTVASFMRAVLRALAECHSRRILHRDVKPGNFMLLDDSDGAPLKSIGACVFCAWGCFSFLCIEGRKTREEKDERCVQRVERGDGDLSSSLPPHQHTPNNTARQQTTPPTPRGRPPLPGQTLASRCSSTPTPSPAPTWAWRAPLGTWPPRPWRRAWSRRATCGRRG